MLSYDRIKLLSNTRRQHHLPDLLVPGACGDCRYSAGMSKHQKRLEGCGCEIGANHPSFRPNVEGTEHQDTGTFIGSPTDSQCLPAKGDVPSRTGSKKEHCSICLENLGKNDGASIELPCTHRFHEQCITPWLWKQNTCPCCRAPADKPVRTKRAAASGRRISASGFTANRGSDLILASGFTVGNQPQIFASQFTAEADPAASASGFTSTIDQHIRATSFTAKAKD